MSKTTNQLEDVFQEVKDYFGSIEGITVVPGEGSPPEKYTVTYSIQGVCRENGGEVYDCDTHVISISLPFGFPHFPPNCIPESPTFHPDFDSSAICIGDVWEKDRSVVQLILHIAQMIAGESFSESNVFNEEAAEWYKENRDRLPFDSAEFSQITPPPLPDQEEESPFEAEFDIVDSLDDIEGEIDTIDTLDDDAFGESFSLEDQEPEEPAIDTDRLEFMARKKRFAALSRELERITEAFPGREELENKARETLALGAELYAEAELLEHKGQQKEALAKFNRVEETVSDYPRIQEAKSRVQQAIDLLGDWVDGDQASKDDEQGQDSLAAGEIDAPEEGEEPLKMGGKGQRTFFEETKVVGKKWFVTALSLGVVALLVTVIFSYFSLSSSLEKAEKAYSQCQDLLDKNNFHVAEKRCDEALAFLTEVRIVKQSEKSQLTNQIQQILNSQKLKQGLAGKIMFQGKYVSDATKEIIVSFQETKRYGDAFFAEERWDEAALSYRKALATAENAEGINDKDLADIRKRMPRAQFNGIMLSGEKALAGSDWHGAQEYFSKALSLAKENPNVLPEDITQLELLSNQAEFNVLRDKGHEYFSDNSWQEALQSYQQALELVAKLGLSRSDTITSLHENIARTRIYMAIEKGKEAFAAAEWDEVINQYEQAIVLLEKNAELLSSINIQESGEKLSRIMLHAEIVKGKQGLAQSLKEEDYERALVQMKAIRETISSSAFATHKEFVTIIEELDGDISETKRKVQIREQSTYLTENYETLFLKHYPAASGSVLSAPKVEFLKKLGEKLLFRMQCTEKASGSRPLRLQMDYLYTPSSGTWEFYTGS